jgi:hypothetical protein
MWGGDVGNAGRDHRYFETHSANGFHGGRKIGFHALGQNMTTFADGQVNAIEPKIFRNGSRFFYGRPLKVFRKHANLQLLRKFASR